ncbi:MAG: hypothetical protein A3E79_16820 [Burkholderiales bacterium RIFCSPHIGHO2_12_FULL_61_11]|nr:MAG: hypothetical protein A3E79_16820 [Burkholderiales bacterium RIFCSPHIGHO2_12_FULL_61_11]
MTALIHRPASNRKVSARTSDRRGGRDCFAALALISDFALAGWEILYRLPAAPLQLRPGWLEPVVTWQGRLVFPKMYSDSF